MRGACAPPAAHHDACQYGEPADKLAHSCRVAEDDDARDRADYRLDVHEGASELRGDSFLPVREERERSHGPCHGQGKRCQNGDQRASGPNCHAARTCRNWQHANCRTKELHGRDRHRIAAAQQARLSDHQRRRKQDRCEDETVAHGRRAG
jgi:hypothetical protein